jgi:hypothetical protein
VKEDIKENEMVTIDRIRKQARCILLDDFGTTGTARIPLKGGEPPEPGLVPKGPARKSAYKLLFKRFNISTDRLRLFDLCIETQAVPRNGAY